MVVVAVVVVVLVVVVVAVVVVVLVVVVVAVVVDDADPLGDNWALANATKRVAMSAAKITVVDLIDILMYVS